MARTHTLFGRAYFALQGTRGGVSEKMVKEAAALLDSLWEDIASHIDRRLRAMHGNSANHLRWLATRPLMDRPEVRSQFDRIAETTLPHRAEKRKTSGSTGTPVMFFKDLEMTAWMDSVMWATYAWHGVYPGAKHARFWGTPRTLLPRARRAWLDSVLHRRRFDAFDVTAASSARFFRELRSFKPDYVYGYPTLIRAFVEHCIEQGLNGRDLSVNVVISTGELLSPETRRAIHEFFGCRVVNEYGCTESGILSIECEFGTPHVAPIAALPEVVSQNGEPVRLGERGELVVSDLYGRVMPLLRYRLHDSASMGQEECACGRSLPRLEPSGGRIDSFIQTPHRGPVYDAILAYTMPSGVQRFRAFQVATDELVVEIVPGAAFQEGRTSQVCRDRLESALGPDFTVSVRVVDSIPTESSGKLRYFVPLANQGPPSNKTPD